MVKIKVLGIKSSYLNLLHTMSVPSPCVWCSDPHHWLTDQAMPIPSIIGNIWVQLADIGWPPGPSN